MAARGLIFNIQKFSVHDGPGIRTTVFFKGCPLSCPWCHNVESQAARRQISVREDRCTACGDCLTHCPQAAIELEPAGARTSEQRCRLCGVCLPHCPRNGREICGEERGVGAVLAEVLKDRVFYLRSGGGVTCSGGEPLAQIDFLSRLLRACKREELHTAVDTSGYAPWESFERILPHTDLLLYDLKLLDDRAHQKITGVSNRPILDNLRRLGERDAETLIRIPIIPGINDAPAQLEGIRAFLEPLGFSRIHLLPFHQLGRTKAERFGRDWPLGELPEPSESYMLEIKQRFEEAGFHTCIGG